MACIHMHTVWAVQCTFRNIWGAEILLIISNCPLEIIIFKQSLIVVRSPLVAGGGGGGGGHRKNKSPGFLLEKIQYLLKNLLSEVLEITRTPSLPSRIPAYIPE